MILFKIISDSLSRKLTGDKGIHLDYAISSSSPALPNAFKELAKRIGAEVEIAQYSSSILQKPRYSTIPTPSHMTGYQPSAIEKKQPNKSVNPIVLSMSYTIKNSIPVCSLCQFCQNKNCWYRNRFRA